MQLSMSRRFRALKIWFVLRSWGRSGVQQHIFRHISVANEFTKLLRTRSDIFEIVCKPQFAMNVMAVQQLWAERAGLSQNDATDKLMQAVNSSGRFWLSGTMIGGQLAIRILSANLNTEMRVLKRLFEFLVHAAETM